MKNLKRILIIFIFIILILGIIFGIYKRINKKEKIEYIPQEEISDEQMRQTMISLYFKNEDKLIPEVRLIDVKELIENPYEKILNLLIEGPKNENLEKTLPDGTRINKIEKNKDMLIIDFNEEFLDNKIDEKIIINSIVKTLTELNEINKIKIIINGEENKEFKNGKIKLNNIFKREEII